MIFYGIQRFTKVLQDLELQKLIKPTKQFWRESTGDYIGKIDNDILVPNGWVDNLVEAHINIPNLGVCGYCHFREEDFDAKKIALKVEQINNINFLIS